MYVPKIMKVDKYIATIYRLTFWGHSCNVSGIKATKSQSAIVLLYTLY